MNEKVKAVQQFLRIHGPMPESLVTGCMEHQGTPVTAEELAAMAEQNQVTAIEFCAAEGGFLYVYAHPACKFRVLNFR